MTLNNNVEKRKVSILIPYYIENGKASIFLQKRKPDAKRLPDYFGFFGGGCEADESPEECLVREIKEELGINISGHSYFCHYEFYGAIMDVFIMEVPKDFSDKVIVGEGEYGKFFSYDQVVAEQKIVNQDRLILLNFFGKVEADDPFKHKN